MEIYIGTFEGIPIFQTISSEEVESLKKQGYSIEEIEEMYQLSDWQTDC